MKAYGTEHKRYIKLGVIGCGCRYCKAIRKRYSSKHIKKNSKKTARQKGKKEISNE